MLKKCELKKGEHQRECYAKKIGMRTRKKQILTMWEKARGWHGEFGGARETELSLKT